jgi:hypothetical protein
METRWSALAAIWCLGVGLVVSPAGAMAPEAAGGFFRAEWSVPALPPAFTKIEGYVYNDSRLRVTDVRLRVASLDTAGRAVGQTMGWVIGDIPPSSRAYFEISLATPAAAYGVTVVSFDVVSGTGE